MQTTNRVCGNPNSCKIPELVEAQTQVAFSTFQQQTDA